MNTISLDHLNTFYKFSLIPLVVIIIIIAKQHNTNTTFNTDNIKEHLSRIS